MVIGVPKEVKDSETRVSVTPSGVQDLTDAGHTVLLETSAGSLSAFTDGMYRAAGATIVPHAADAWSAELVAKVKEPIEQEYGFFRNDLTLFTYLHLAPLPALTDRLLIAGVTGIAYETVQSTKDSLPLLTPMSEVAGRLSIQVGATYLQHGHGGRGVLLGGVPGVPPARVCVLGGGIVGLNAARMALGLGADVTILDLSGDRLREIDNLFEGRIKTLASNSYNITNAVRHAELVIGGVLIPGTAAPKLLTEPMVKQMLPGSVIVDVAIDQGGCVETAQPTRHSNPSYVLHGVVHYCVTNMPAAVPHTSTLALTNATLPYLQQLADLGPVTAMKKNTGLAMGLNTYRGELTHAGVAESQGRAFVSTRQLLT